MASGGTHEHPSQQAALCAFTAKSLTHRVTRAKCGKGTAL